MRRKRFDSSEESQKTTTISSLSYYQRDVNDVRLMSWKSGHTVCRLLPNIDPESEVPKLDPYRVDTERGVMRGNWYYSAPAVDYKGITGTKVSFLVATDVIYDGKTLVTNPYSVLRQAVFKFVKSAEASGRDIPAAFNKAKEDLKDITEVAFMPAQVFINGMDPLDENACFEKQTILRIKGNQLINRFNMLLDKREALARERQEEWDPIALNPTGKGAFITFFAPGKADPTEPGIAHDIELPKGDIKFDTYNLRISDTYPCKRDPWFGNTPNIDPAMEVNLCSIYKDWGEILNFIPFEEQAEQLIQAYPPELCAYAWQDHKEWIPESAKSAGNQVHVPNIHPTATAPSYQSQNFATTAYQQPVIQTQPVQNYQGNTQAAQNLQQFLNPQEQQIKGFSVGNQQDVSVENFVASSVVPMADRVAELTPEALAESFSAWKENSDKKSAEPDPNDIPF